MTNFIRKIHLALALLLISSISYGHGEDALSCGENQNPLYCQSCCRCDRVSLSGDFLYWRAFEGGLDSCVPEEFSDIVTSDGRVISRFSGRGREPHFKWSPGFRIGLGYESSYSEWDIAACWTHFRSHSHGPNHHGNKIQWKINLDVIDLVAGYEFDLAPCFTLRPYGGLRGARIYQNLRIREFPSSISTELFTLNKKDKARFLGIGPLFGVEGDWAMGCGFSVFTNVSLSWLYGNFHTRFGEFEGTSDTENFCQIKRHLDAVQAVADVAVGVRWQKCLCENVQLLLELSLEHHRYFDHNRIGGYGDVCFDGVVVGGGVEF